MFYVLSEYSVENNFQGGQGKKGVWELAGEITKFGKPWAQHEFNLPNFV